jgi:hypothetical protein
VVENKKVIEEQIKKFTSDLAKDTSASVEADRNRLHMEALRLYRTKTLPKSLRNLCDLFNLAHNHANKRGSKKGIPKIKQIGITGLPLRDIMEELHCSKAEAKRYNRALKILLIEEYITKLEQRMQGLKVREWLEEPDPSYNVPKKEDKLKKEEKE